jgi:AcrR family transcriptional regulator
MSHESKEALVEEFRRDSIVAAALRVIARKGAQAATMQQIADAAGIAKGTIYLYFDSREALIERAGDRAFGELLARLQSVLAEGGPLPERLRALFLALISFFDENREFLRVHMEVKYGEADAAVDARHGRRSKPLYQQYLALLERFLARAMERGEAKRVDAGRLAAFLAEGMSAVLLKRLGDGAIPREEEAEWLVDLVLHGLTPGERA